MMAKTGFKTRIKGGTSKLQAPTSKLQRIFKFQASSFKETDWTQGTHRTKGWAGGRMKYILKSQGMRRCRGSRTRAPGMVGGIFKLETSLFREYSSFKLGKVYGPRSNVEEGVTSGEGRVARGKRKGETSKSKLQSPSWGGRGGWQGGSDLFRNSLRRFLHYQGFFGIVATGTAALLAFNRRGWCLRG